MAIIDHLQCGKIVIFNSMLFKLRWAFCINYNMDQQVVYRGLFGLKTVDKKTFLGFARIVDIFDYMDRPLTQAECSRIKVAHKTGLMANCDNVQEYVGKLFDIAEIKLFINPEGWVNEDIHKG